MKIVITDHRFPNVDQERRAVEAAGGELVVAQLTDYVTPGDESAADKIRAGEGAILREGAKKIAAYRDEEGTLHKFSAVCPHLKCVVRWDGCEKTWDCPCHGSRFDALGHVINGPAVADLKSTNS